MNILMHMFVLFTFLTVFFFTYISRKGEKEIDNILSKTIKSQTPVLMRSLESVVGIDIADKSLNEVADKLIKPERMESDVHDHNKKLLVLCVIIITGLTVLLIGTIAWYGPSTIGLRSIIVNNAVIFMLVGLIEAYFFMTVAFKFVPVNNADMINDIVDRSVRAVRIRNIESN